MEADARTQRPRAASLRRRRQQRRDLRAVAVTATASVTVTVTASASVSNAASVSASAAATAAAAAAAAAAATAAVAAVSAADRAEKSHLQGSLQPTPCEHLGMAVADGCPGSVGSDGRRARKLGPRADRQHGQPWRAPVWRRVERHDGSHAGLRVLHLRALAQRTERVDAEPSDGVRKGAARHTALLRRADGGRCRRSGGQRLVALASATQRAAPERGEQEAEAAEREKRKAG